MQHWFIGILVLSLSACATTDAGLVTQPSQFDVNTTTQRLTDLLEKRGLTVFKVVDHSAGAKSAGLSLRPTRVVIFGNPKVGTPLMQCGQITAIDLPQKALIHEDAAGTTWLSYNDPKYLASRHGLSECQAAIDRVANALARFSATATGNLTE